MGKGLYWIPKVTGATEGLDLFASWGRSFALMGQKTLGRHCPQPRFTGAGTDSTLAPQGGPEAKWMRGHLAYKTCLWPLLLHCSRGHSKFLFICSAVWPLAGPCAKGPTACNSAICLPRFWDGPCLQCYQDILVAGLNVPGKGLTCLRKPTGALSCLHSMKVCGRG